MFKNIHKKVGPGSDFQEIIGDFRVDKKGGVFDLKTGVNVARSLIEFSYGGGVAWFRSWFVLKPVAIQDTCFYRFFLRCFFIYFGKECFMSIVVFEDFEIFLIKKSDFRGI